MALSLNKKIKVATANSVYHLGEAGEEGARTISCDGRALSFESGVLLGPCKQSFLGAELCDGPLRPGFGMAFMPANLGEVKAWCTSPIKSIENE